MIPGQSSVSKAVESQVQLRPELEGSRWRDCIGLAGGEKSQGSDVGLGLQLSLSIAGCVWHRGIVF